MIVMSVAVLIDNVPLYFVTEIVLINILMVVVTRHQEKLSVQLLAQIEDRKTPA
jgi:hypothetical protein